MPQDHDVVTDNEVGTSIFAIFEHLKESESEGKGAVVRISLNDKGVRGGGGNFDKTFCTSLSSANVIDSIETCAVENLLKSDNNKPVAFKPSLSSHFESFISSTRFGSANELRTTKSEIRKLWIIENGGK